jgi:hypothetical protein
MSKEDQKRAEGEELITWERRAERLELRAASRELRTEN